jgi:hypothetical protein
VEFCERIKPYNVKWFPAMRVDSKLPLDLLSLMKRSGCDAMQIGIESLDDSVLNSMQKKTTVQMIEQFLRTAKKAGVDAGGGLIFGDPAETIDTLNNSINFVKKNADLFPWLPIIPIILFPGSKLYEDAVKNGKINPLEHIRNLCPAVNVTSMSNKDYLRCVKELIPAAMQEMNLLIREKYYSDKVKGKLTAFNKRTLTFEAEYVCPRCGETHRRSVRIDQFFDLFFFRFCCDKCCYELEFECGFEDVDFGEIKQNIEISVKKLFERADGDIAVWGIGKFYDAYHGFFGDLETKYGNGRKFILCDKSKAGTRSIDGRKIYCPDDVMPDVKYCITSTRFWLEIRQTINREFANCESIAFFEIVFYGTRRCEYFRKNRVAYDENLNVPV